MEKRLERKECLFFEGVAMLECDISLPQVDFGKKGDKRINKILSLIFSHAKKTADTLYEKAKAEYIADGDEKKRFRHRPYRYTLFCRVTECDGEYFSFITEASVFHRGKALRTQKSARVMRKKDGRIMPFDVIYGKGARKTRKSLKKSKGITDFSSFYSKGDRLFLLFCSNGRWQSIEISKNAKQSLHNC